MQLAGRFSNAEAYNRHTGRISQLLAPQFIDFAGVKDGECLLDVGCGTGSLAFAASVLNLRSEIVGIDRSESFIEYDRAQTNDPRLRFEVGDALSLPYTDGSFDKCLSLLVVQFFPDVRRALSEMWRVTRQEGAVAACVWDRDEDDFHTFFWNSAAEISPEAGKMRDTRGYVAGQLSALWAESGFTSIDETALVLWPEFQSFNEYWTPMVEGQGPAGSYLASLSADKQVSLRERVRAKVLGAGPDRPFKLKAKAWAVRGAK
jgi:ubiquinone/menaquinone biosynthesis C-methylase UbiE